MATGPLTPSQRERITSAQGSSLQWDKACSHELDGLLDSHSIKTFPKEFILLPLLAAVAALVGTNGCVEITKTWTEPAILWTLVAAKKGSKKSAALKVIQKALESYSGLIVERFSMAALFDEMHENGGRMLGLYDEMRTHFTQLPSSDRSQLCTLSNGRPWSRRFKNNVKKTIPKTAFSIAGFIQPDYVIRMLEKDDSDGFNDRYLIVCPPEHSARYEDLASGISDPQLKDIFDCVSQNHNSCKTYTLTSEAHKNYGAFYDSIEENTEENKDGVLSKVQGQCARLAMILHVLKQAFLHLSHCQNATQPETSPDWSETIEKDTIDQAIVLIKHFISQKSLLMPQEIVPTPSLVPHPTSSQTSTSHIRFHNRHLEETHLTVERFLKYPSPLKASVVSRYRLCPPNRSSKNKYPVSSAKEYMYEIAEEGFGEATPDGRRNSLVFRKRKFSELGTHQKELVLKKLRLSPHDYDDTPQSQ